MTFAGIPFFDPATAYSAAEGLYADASAVTDTNTDTNTVVGHAASIAITDTQAPTGTVSLGTPTTFTMVI